MRRTFYRCLLVQYVVSDWYWMAGCLSVVLDRWSYSRRSLFTLVDTHIESCFFKYFFVVNIIVYSDRRPSTTTRFWTWLTTRLRTWLSTRLRTWLWTWLWVGELVKECYFGRDLFLRFHYLTLLLAVNWRTNKLWGLLLLPLYMVCKLGRDLVLSDLIGFFKKFCV